MLESKDEYACEPIRAWLWWMSSSHRGKSSFFHGGNVSAAAPPSVPALVAAIKACSSARDIDAGRRIHAAAAISGLDSNVFVANTLLSMYAKCGRMELAQRLFDAMAIRTVVSWNALLLGYAQDGNGSDRALEAFGSMMEEGGIDPDARTCSAVLKALSISLEEVNNDSTKNKNKLVMILERTLAVHAWIERDGYGGDVFVASSLVDLYAKCGSLIDAWKVFERMDRRDAVLWTALVQGHVQCCEWIEALDLFSEMVGDGIRPDGRSFLAALKACAGLASELLDKDEDQAEVLLGSEERCLRSSNRNEDRSLKLCLEIGLAIHSEAEKTGLLDRDLFLASSLVDLYAKCGILDDARRVFERMNQRDVVTWNSLLMGYAQRGEAEIVLGLFDRLRRDGQEPDSRTYIAVFKALANFAARNDGDDQIKSRCLDRARRIHSRMRESWNRSSSIFLCSALVDMYSKCGSLADAREIFDEVSKPDLVLWNSIILGCALNDESELGLELFDRLQEQGIKPDDGTFVAALKACGNIAALETGRKIHSQVSDAGFDSNPVVATSLVDFYSKSGSMDEARDVFDSMPPSKRSSVTWNSLLSGYSRAGEHDEVFRVFETMQSGLTPSRARSMVNGATFLCILNACSHAGMVDRAKTYFESMRDDFGIAAGRDHYACMVDLFGRSNQMEAAVGLAQSLSGEEGEEGLKRAVWMAVLSSSERVGDRRTGELAFEMVVRLNPDDAPAYVLLANSCL